MSTSPATAPGRVSRPGRALAGCLVAVGIVMLILGIVALVVLTSWRGWTASLINEGAAVMINEADIPEGEKPEMVAHINDYTAAFEAGDLGFEQFADVVTQLETSSLIPVGMVYVVEQRYLQPAEMPEEEKQAGTLALQRLARAVHEKTLPSDAIEQVIEPVSYREADGTLRLNVQGTVTPDMLREVISRAAARADEAGVPAEPFVVDLSDELKRVLDASRSPTP